MLCYGYVAKESDRAPEYILQDPIQGSKSIRLMFIAVVIWTYHGSEYNMVLYHHVKHPTRAVHIISFF